jgi:ribosome maturation factor RimP
MGFSQRKREKQIVKIIEELAFPLVNRMGLELVGIEYKPVQGKPKLVVYIDKPGGVFLEDCERLSKSLGDLLDREDPIYSSYILEVSSPGIERPLKKKEDFSRFQENYVKIKTCSKIKDRKNFTGLLKGLEGEFVILQTDEGGKINIPFNDIVKANLLYK